MPLAACTVEGGGAAAGNEPTNAMANGRRPTAAMAAIGLGCRGSVHVHGISVALLGRRAGRDSGSTVRVAPSRSADSVGPEITCGPTTAELRATVTRSEANLTVRGQVPAPL